MTASRIGIFGGAFDPIHLGHLLVAWAAREEARLDQMIFVPAGVSPFKQDQVLVPSDLRLRMLRLALLGMEWCSVDDIEIRRGGVSYTVDTVRTFQLRYPEADLFLLVGEDNLKGLPLWREVESLAKMVEFLVVPRPGIQAALEFPGARLRRLEGWSVRLSSSQIRERVAHGLPIRHLVPGVVEEVIQKNQLYLG